MSEAKQYAAIAVTIIGLLSVASTYLFYISRMNNVIQNPESAPEVATEIIEKEIVEPLEREVRIIERLILFLVSLPTPVLILLLLAYSYSKR